MQLSSQINIEGELLFIYTWMRLLNWVMVSLKL